MTGVHTFRVLSAVLSLLICCGGVQGQVPDPSLNGQVHPDALRMGPPPVLKPGTRLTYFGGSSSVPGVRVKLVPKEGGGWHDPVTGKQYGEKELQGTGGVGYTVVRVGHVDKQAVLLNTSMYLYDPLARTVSFTGGAGMVTDAGAGADYWIHPKYLNSLKEMREPGVFIGRMPYVVGNRKYNAIRFQTETQNGHTAYVYDLDSGLLIYYGSSTVGANVLTPPAGSAGVPGVGAGSTNLAHNMLVEVKDIDLPWKDAPVPQWVNQFREVRYDGGITVAIQGVPPSTQAITYTIVPKARQNGWLRFVSTTVQNVYGLPPQRSTTEGATGHATYAGLWVSPQALAKLKPGQVIETHDLLKTKVVVSDISRGYATITEGGQLHRLDVGYDMTTGLMAGVTLQQRNQIGVTTTQVRLSGQR